MALVLTVLQISSANLPEAGRRRGADYSTLLRRKLPEGLMGKKQGLFPEPGWKGNPAL